MNIKNCIFFINIILCLIISTNISATTIGDVNEDGQVNIVDSLMVAQSDVGIIPKIKSINLADVDINGIVNIIDALIIAKHYIGQIQNLPKNLEIPPLSLKYRVIKIPIITSNMLEKKEME